MSKINDKDRCNCEKKCNDKDWCDCQKENDCKVWCDCDKKHNDKDQCKKDQCGHVHFVKAETTVNDDHSHQLIFATPIEDPIFEEEN